MIKINFKLIDLLRGLIIAILFIVLSFSAFNLLESAERMLYGVEMRLAISPSGGASKIAIVNIDEKSLEQLGSWPWPRYLIAEMITILKNNGAKLVGLDLLFDEKEQNQGLEEIRKLSGEIVNLDDEKERRNDWLLTRLNEIEQRLDNDKMLLQAVKETNNIILPVYGTFGKYESELVITKDSVLDPNMMTLKDGEKRLKDFVSVNQLRLPFEELSRVGRGLGHINLSENQSMIGRNHLLFFDFRGHIIPSMPFRLALEFMGEPYNSLALDKEGISLAGAVIPSATGEILIKFKGGRRSFPYYSFVDILNVKKVPAVFDGKIVLMGFTAEGGTSVKTPVDPQMPRVEYIANVIDNLLNSRCLKRPGTMIYFEAFLLLIIILASSIILPELNQLNRISLIAGTLLIVIFGGVISFIVFDIWFKTVYICLAIIALYVVILITDIIVSQRTIGIRSKEFIESNRMLGLSLQSQGLLDLAFEKFRRCPLDSAMKDVIYNLGLDYERKRMINKAISVYEYIEQDDNRYRDLNNRIKKLKEAIGGLPSDDAKRKKEDKIMVVDDLEIRPTVGRYEIIREIGHGAMGVVYEAMDPKINRRLAIKTIRFSDEFEENRLREIKERFFSEAEIAGKLSHPSIVSIYDAGEDYDLTYLAMEFLEGMDLREYCNKGSLLPLKKVLKIVRDSAIALDYAHTQQVVHRDVKPGNIMLIKNGQIKVMDFGIAKALSTTQTKSGTVLGTPNYMSPEQINGQKVDGRSDIFSLGVVFFELLTGQVPFHGKNITNLLYQITQVKHPSIREINQKVPKVCEQIIDRALEKKAESRFQKAGEMAKYLNAMIQKMDQLGATVKK